MIWTDAETALAREMLKRNATDAEFRAALGRTRLCAKARMDRVDFRNTLSRRTPQSPYTKVPDEVAEERVRRALAPQPAFGDPPIGFSALDRKRASGASA